MSALQREVADASQELHARGWVANHDGNVSARAPDNRRFFATPTACSKREVEPHHVLTIDIEGKRLSGRGRIFSEWNLHAVAYKAREDVRAVLHAHPRFATGLGLARRPLGVPALPEMIVSLGANIPLLEYGAPRSEEQERALRLAVTEGDADVVLLAGNGVLALGADLEQAYLRLELVEHYAGIVAAATSLGGVTPLPTADVELLLAARTKAGLGRAGRAKH